MISINHHPTAFSDIFIGNDVTITHLKFRLTTRYCDTLNQPSFQRLETCMAFRKSVNHHQNQRISKIFIIFRYSINQHLLIFIFLAIKISYQYTLISNNPHIILTKHHYNSQQLLTFLFNTLTINNSGIT